MKISRNKWKNHKLMMKNDRIKSYLPETHLFTEDALWDLLDAFGGVMIKPVLGYKGRGIIQVSSIGNNNYQIHKKHRKVNIRGKRKTYDQLKDMMSPKKRYIVQQKIPLASINGCPYDIRVMLQRISRSTDWNITGELVKVAVKGFVVTNIASSLLPLKEGLMASTVKVQDLVGLVKEMETLSLITADHFGKCYPKTRMIGLDLGVDNRGKLWIIEANFRPSVEVFNQMDDKSMYKRIKKFRRKARKRKKKKRKT